MVDLFSNHILLTNTRESKHILKRYCNAGKDSVTQKGYLRGYGTVWYYADHIAVILSLKWTEIAQVTYGSTDGSKFTVGVVKVGLKII